MRFLVANLGNTSAAAAEFAGERLVRVWRTAAGGGFDPVKLVARARGPFDAAAFASVVPAGTAALGAALAAHTGVEPRQLTATAGHGLRIGYVRPREMGADRVAAVLGARALFPRQHVIVVDCGTATTVTALTAGGDVPGGAILPGAALWADVLHTRTAQLPAIAVPRRAPRALGRGTQAAISSGLWHGHAGAIREIVAALRREVFGPRAQVRVIATGGAAGSWAGAGLFHREEPALVLHGLRAFAQFGTPDA